jgi:hypothetical protein
LYWRYASYLDIDCSIGILVCVIISYLFHQLLRFDVFAFSLVMAHFPDADFIFFLMVRNKMRIPSHWIVGHHPVIIIPVAGIVAVITSNFLGLDVWYVLSIAVLDVLLHFIHDSVQYQGLHWFSPFLGTFYF